MFLVLSHQGHSDRGQPSTRLSTFCRRLNRAASVVTLDVARGTRSVASSRTQSPASHPECLPVPALENRQLARFVFGEGHKWLVVRPSFARCRAQPALVGLHWRTLTDS